MTNIDNKFTEADTLRFIERAKKIHGDKYDYSKSKYNGSVNKLIVTCPEHGDFLVSPNKHLNRRGCPKCAEKRRNDAHRLYVDDFIKKAREVHGDKYDYSLVTELNGTRSKVKIICPIHGIFEQNVNSHINAGVGCPKCADTRLTNEDFIKKAREVHGDKYDYSLVNYINNHTKVKIICPKHGVFEQKPSMHLLGQGCRKCSTQKRCENIQMTREEFIKRAREVHGDKFDYSLIKEFNNGVRTIVKIICPKHGVFEQIANSHLQGNGCGRCSGSIPMTLEDFIFKSKEVHGDKYDYSLIKEFKGVKSKVKIICPKHGIFEQKPIYHYNGTECPECFKEKRREYYDSICLTNEEFIRRAKEIHGDKYDYSLVDYKTNKDKVKIICPKHGIFEQTPSIHLRGSKCRKCTSQTSKQEKEVVEFIKSFYNGEIIENDRIQIKPKELDIYLPELKIAIEYNGEYWHLLQEERDPGYHERKYNECKEKGIELILVWNEDWTKNNEETKNKIKEQILSKLNYV